MAVTADSVIVELQATTEGYEAKMLRAAQTGTRAMSQIESSATKAETAVRTSAVGMTRAADQMTHGFNNTRVSQQILMHVARASADQFAAGAPPMQIFTMHLAQLAEAGAYAGGALGAFGRFLSGPWGIAATFGVMALVPLISRLIDTRSELDKATEKLRDHAHNADIARQAQEAFGRTLPGIAAAIRDETEAIVAQNRSLEQNQQLALGRAQSHVATLQATEAATRRYLASWRQELAQAEAAFAAATRGPESREPGGAASFRVQSAQQRLERARQSVAQLEQRLQTVLSLLPAAQREAFETQVPIATRQAEALVDPLVAITQQYDRMRDAAIAAARGNEQLARSLTGTLAGIERQRRAAEEAERARQHADEDLVRGLYRPVAGSVLSPFGVPRPASGRLPAHRHAGVDLNAPVGTEVRAPYSGMAQRRDNPGGLGYYVEIRLDNGLRAVLGHLSGYNIPGGGPVRVEQGQVVGYTGGGMLRPGVPRPGAGNAAGTPPHLHYELWQGRRAIDPLGGHSGGQSVREAAEAAARAAAALAERRARDEEVFQRELASLDVDLASARRQQVQTAEEAAAFEIQQIEAARDRRNQQFRDEAADRTRRDQAQAAIYTAEAEQAIALNNQVAAIHAATVRDREQQRLDQQRLDLASSALNDQQAVEQARGQLARTTGERLTSELRLLDLQHQEELLAIEKLRLDRTLNDAQRQALDARETAANQRYGYARQATVLHNLTPLQQFMDRAPQTAAQMDEALQNVAANGLSALNDGLAEAVTNFLHLGGTAGRIVNQMISDLVRLLAYRYITAPLANMIGSSGGLGSLFGGGGGGFDFLSAASALAPGAFATGGSIIIGGRGGVDQNLLSLNGQPVARVSQGERIDVIPQGKAPSGFGARVARVGGGGAGTLTVNVRVDARDAVLTDTVQGWVAAGVQHGVNLATGYTDKTVSGLMRPRLNRG